MFEGGEHTLRSPKVLWGPDAELTERCFALDEAKWCARMVLGHHKATLSPKGRGSTKLIKIGPKMVPKCYQNVLFGVLRWDHRDIEIGA